MPKNGWPKVGLLADVYCTIYMLSIIIIFYCTVNVDL